MHYGLQAGNLCRRLGRRIFPLGQKRRGAALVMAVAILAIIVAIAIAFFSTSRIELNIADNVANTARADLLANAGLSMAMAFINHDLLTHSTYTSVDFATFSYFDGSWVAAKRWAFLDRTSWRDKIYPPLLGPATALAAPDFIRDPSQGVPYIDMTWPETDGRLAPKRGVNLPLEDPNNVYNVNQPNSNAAVSSAGHSGRVFSANSRAIDTSPWIYIPRLQDGDPIEFDRNEDGVNGSDWAVEPSFLDNNIVYRKQIIHGWADVDSDDDGYRDAMWIPVPADLNTGNRDVDGNGRVDVNNGIDIRGDGIDNNLNNGLILNTNVAPDINGVLQPVDDNLDGDPATGDGINDGFDGVDEIGEPATFLYIGAADGIDNDLDGEIDEADEGYIGSQPVVWQTIPLPGVNTLAAVVYPDRVRDIIQQTVALDNAGNPVVNLSNNVLIRIDRIDNDYDMLANNGLVLSFDASDIDTARDRQDAIERVIPFIDPRVKGMSQISDAYTGAGTIIFAKGEPATEVIGRVAIHVRDTAAQVNLNTSGGHRFAENSAQEAAIGATSGDAALWGSNIVDVGTTIPAVNQGLGPQEYLTSALPGVGDDMSRALWQNLIGTPSGVNSYTAIPNAYILDAVRPGYGGVDDNGSALWMAMDGIDNDGDGFIDEGLNPAYPELFGQFEGIDEPGEFRTYRPYRNVFAEANGIDDDADDLVDEVGELGDATMRTEDGTLDVADAIESVVPGFAFGRDEIEAALADAMTIHSSDKNMRHQLRAVQSFIAPETGRVVPTGDIFRGITGLKLDYNYAAAPRIAEALRRDWAYDAPPTFLRLSPIANPAVNYAHGLRTEGLQWFYDSTDFANSAVALFVGGGVDATFNVTEFPDITTDPNYGVDRELRANQIAANIQDYRDSDSTQTRVTTAETDPWWLDLQASIALYPPDAESRPIRYTQAGVESIRINELMVRPTRRIEAEMMWEGNLDIVTAPWEPTLDVNTFNPNAAYGAPSVNWIDPVTGGPAAEFRVSQRFMNQFNAVDITDTADLDWGGVWHEFDNGGGFLPDHDGDGITDVVDATMGAAGTILTGVPVTTVGGTVVPNAVMYEFRPSPSLPPGKYYLTINTMRDTRVPYSTTIPVGSESDITIYTKYVSATGNDMPSGATVGTTDILTDLVRDANGTFGWGNPGIDVEPVPTSNIIVGGPGGVGVADPEQGNLFVGTTGVRRSGLVNPEFAMGGTKAGYEQDAAFTVEIPPYSFDDIRLQVAIYFPNPPTAAIPLRAINYFEFSQEPDHEWVEVVNIAEPDGSLPLELQAIDMSGWELEVGTGGEGERRYTIPQGTTISPGGMLLLAANKADSYDERSFDATGTYVGAYGNFGDLRVDFQTLGVFYRNGIGLQAYNGDNVDFDAFNAGKVITSPYESNIISVPQFPPVDPNTVLPLGNIPSTFWAVEDTDFIDYTGNSFSDSDLVTDPGTLLAHYYSLTAPATLTRGLRDNYVRSTPFDNSAFGATGNPPNKAYDRVVQLINNELAEIGFDAINLESPDIVVGEIAEVVLRGGILPNYPERDGIDNDGDSARLLSTLTIDGIDNDGDGLVDEQEDISGTDDNGNGIIDISEGVDENRWPLGVRNTVPGSPAESAGLMAPLTSINASIQSFDRPGSFARPFPSTRLPGPLPVGVDSDGDQLITSNDFSAFGGGYVIPNGQPGNVSPPTWKAFVEKRMYPGDVVRVTLYEGPADRGRIADQVSYTELDVINRSIHDGIFCPYQQMRYIPSSGTYIVDGPGTGALDGQNTSFWPEDSMGLDFYRSLERRHPLWHGDLAGTTNRWEATDGAYDDWDSSRTATQISLGGSAWWEPLAPDAQQISLFAHQFGGSPLRENFWQRLTDNPGVRHLDDGGNPTILNTQFGNDNTGPPLVPETILPTFNPVSTSVRDIGDLATLSPYSPERRWTLTRVASIRNRTLTSPADLIRMPAMTMNRRVFSAVDGAGDGGNDANQSGPSIDGLRSVLLGESDPLDFYSIGTDVYAGVASGNPDELTAAVSTGASSPVVLSVAQADVLSMSPNGIVGDRAVNWDFSDTVNGDTPFGWAPVFLFPMPSVGENAINYNVNPYLLAEGLRYNPPYDLNTQFLFNNQQFTLTVPGTPGSEYVASLNARWPLRTRTAMFVSGNIPGFNPFQPARVADLTGGAGGEPPNPAAEALFIWDGADGLENGEYDVYLVTAEPVTPLIRANLYQVNVQNGSPLLSDFALNVLLPRIDLVDPAELPVDVEIFSDRNGNNSPFIDSFDFSTQPDLEFALDRGQVPALGVGDSYGMLTGLAPGTDGVVHYGTVKVENNMLAVFLRNWADRGKLNRFSRVILTPRTKTRGRININTASAAPTSRDEFLSNGYDFNATRGLPGLWMNYLATNASLAQPLYPFPPVSQVDPNGVGLAANVNNPNWVDRILSQGIEAGKRAILPDPSNTPLVIDWVDGRYYRQPSDLFAWSQELLVPDAGGQMATVRNWNSGLLSTAYVYDLLTGGVSNAESHTARNSYAVFDESTRRLSRMYNLITTRTDTFEVFVTAQSGYLASTNIGGDGNVDYRSDFVPTGEKRIRVVYER